MLVRTFGLGDVSLVVRLQREGIWLDSEASLIQPGLPLWATLAGLVPLLVGATYVLEEEDGRGAGFVLVRGRRGRPEADIAYITPRLEEDGDQEMWRRLLLHASTKAGERGIQRLFAAFPEEQVGIEAFLQTGFTIYAQEDIFRLDASVTPEALLSSEVRPFQAEDLWAVSQLRLAVAPPTVRQAENLGTGDNVWPMRGKIYLLEIGGKLVGSLRVNAGRAGCWLEMLLHREAHGQAENLVASGLALLAERTSCPIYCGVRSYQGGLVGPLTDRGFQHFASWSLMVKHITARVRELVLDELNKLVPALEKGAEPVRPTLSRSKPKTNGSVP